MPPQEESGVSEHDHPLPGASEREQGVEGEAQSGDHDALPEDRGEQPVPEKTGAEPAATDYVPHLAHGQPITAEPNATIANSSAVGADSIDSAVRQRPHVPQEPALAPAASVPTQPTAKLDAWIQPTPTPGT